MIRIEFKVLDESRWVSRLVPDSAAKCWLVNPNGLLQAVLKGSERRYDAYYEPDPAIIPNTQLGLVAIELSTKEDGTFGLHRPYPITHWKVDPASPTPQPCYVGMYADEDGPAYAAVLDQSTGRVTCADGEYPSLAAYLDAKNATGAAK